jgi:DNA-directed RNA polymerase beta subunit
MSFTRNPFLTNRFPKETTGKACSFLGWKPIALTKKKVFGSNFSKNKMSYKKTLISKNFFFIKALNCSVSAGYVEKTGCKLPVQFSMEIPNLIDVQRQSFYSFIEYGLKEAFQKPLRFSTTKHDLEIRFFPEGIQFRKPDFTQKQAVVLGKIYGSAVYIPVGIHSKKSSTFRIEWLFVGILPIMTRQGHFVVNGVSRVVLHQMVRNPGIYTLPIHPRTKIGTLRIVPEKGGWIHITVDKKHRVWFLTRNLRRKVSLLIFLQAVGIPFHDIFLRLEHSKILQNSFVAELGEGSARHDDVLERAGLYAHPATQEEAWQYLYSHFKEYSPYAHKNLAAKEQTAREFFYSTLWNKDKLILGHIGRQQFREKIGSIEPLENTSLTREDLLEATQALLSLMHKKRVVDEIDSLTQKRIRGCDEFLLEHLATGMKEFELFFRRKVTFLPATKSITGAENPLDSLWRQNKAVFSKTVSKSWKRFFTSGTLGQFMDQTNSLAETTHKRRLTVLGPGGISGKQTTIQIRGIHPTYYGRLCPIETPEGKNAGLVNSFTVLSVLSKYGARTLTTPFYQVYKGQVQKTLPPLRVSPRQEYKLIEAPADIQLTAWNVLPKTHLPVRKELNFHSDVATRITTQSVGILQNISVATSLIPFLEHNDANRALMGSNMQRQAVPLLKPQAPLVGTGLESRVIGDVNHSMQASKTGFITKVSSTKIQVLSPRKTKAQVSVFSHVLFSLSKKKKKSLLNSEKQSFSKNGIFFIKTLQQKSNLKNIFFSAQKALYQENSSFDLKFEAQNRLFIPKMTFSLAQNFSRKIPFLSFFFKKKKERPRNPKKFFRSSDSFVNWKHKKLHSEDFRKNKVEITTTYSLIQYQRTNQSTCFSERPILPENEWVEKGDLLADGASSSQGKLSIGQNVLVAYLPWEGYNFEDAILISQRLVDQEIFTSLHMDHYDIAVQNTQYGLERITNLIPLKISDSTRDIYKMGNLDSRGLVEIGSWVEPGDYLVGKMSPLDPKSPPLQSPHEKLYNVILQREKTSFRNTSLRVPKGVQGFVLGVQILPSQEPDVAALAEKDEILRVRVLLLQRRKIQVGDKMAGRHGNKGIVSLILPRQDMPYLPDGTPVDIVLNPLGVPSRMNVGQILECLLGLAGHFLHERYTTYLFDEQYGAEASRSLVYSKLYQASLKTRNPWVFEPHHPGKIRVFDGRTGLPFDQPITAGYAYILKLVHLVDDKIHARPTGPYSAITQQPVKGRARNGGQRLGEMEVWALQAYGAAHTLHEFFTVKSDDLDGRQQAVLNIYANKPVTTGNPESFKLILRELQALCFNFQVYEKYSYYSEYTQKTRVSIFPISFIKLEDVL